MIKNILILGKEMQGIGIRLAYVPSAPAMFLISFLSMRNFQKSPEMKYFISKFFYKLIRRVKKIGKGAIISLLADIQTSNSLFLGAYSKIEKFVTISAPGGTKIEIGNNSQVRAFSILQTLGEGFIRIGDNTTVNPFCLLYGFGGLDIGNNVMVAAQVIIIAAEHIYDSTEVPMVNQGAEGKGVKIEDDVWVGAGAKVLDGVTIGKGAVIGAGAVVTRSIPPYSVVAGVPAKILRMRKE